MATLFNPTLSIEIVSGFPEYVTATATVSVALTPFESFLVGNGLGLQLTSNLRGEDGGLNGGDDDLFLFPTTFNITSEGTYTFQSIISSGTLDEDNGDDEVYSNFSLVSTEPTFPLNTSISTPHITGEFG